MRDGPFRAEILRNQNSTEIGREMLGNSPGAAAPPPGCYSCSLLLLLLQLREDVRKLCRRICQVVAVKHFRCLPRRKKGFREKNYSRRYNTILQRFQFT